MTGPRSDEEIERLLREVVIGEFETTPIVIADYDPEWPRRFEREARRIREALHGRARRIEHIGSTSVPGLPAKPIVDILLVVDDSADEASYLSALETSGYVLRIREPDFHEHRMLRTAEKDVHIHVLSHDSPEIRRYLLFRDRLRRDAADREFYAQCKRRLATREWPTMQHYAEAKTEVVEAIISRAEATQGDGGGGA